MMLKWLLTVPRVMEYDDLVEIETKINLMDHSAKRLETAKKTMFGNRKGNLYLLGGVEGTLQHRVYFILNYTFRVEVT